MYEKSANIHLATLIFEITYDLTSTVLGIDVFIWIWNHNKREPSTLHTLLQLQRIIFVRSYVDYIGFI